MTGRRRSATERFWHFVAPDPNSGCWLWTGAIDEQGYGRLGVGSGARHIAQRAHRFSYERFVGPIPDGMLVCHKCDTPCCVNPKHLYAATQATNIRDCMSRGRHRPRRGAQHPDAKLTEADVREIRASSLGCRALARRYGVVKATIYQVRAGISWKHVA